MRRLVLIGGGGHAKVVLEAAHGLWDEFVLVDDDPSLVGASLLNHGVVGRAEGLSDGAEAIVTVGNNAVRSRLLDELEADGITVATVIHPSAILSPSARISTGVFVGPGAVVGAETTILRGAIINTSASVDHDCVIGDCAHIGPGAHLCGQITVGARSLVGVGASVRPCTTIGEDCRIGAGAAVVDAVPDGLTVIGVPARPIRSPLN